MTRIGPIGMIALIAAVPATAQTAMVSITVKPSDFSSLDAQAKLDRRVAAAVEDICRTHTAIEFYQSAEVTDCRRSARVQLNATIAQIRAEATEEGKSR